MSMSFLEILSGHSADELQLLRNLQETDAIGAIEKILEVVVRATGMGFASVVRVTESRWIACAVVDESGFGMVPGGELPVETTLCDSMRKSGEAIVIDDVRSDPTYCDHQCPVLYNFRSYASVPIRLADGSFFGSLCAFDPEPRELKARHTDQLFARLAELIAAQLDRRCSDPGRELTGDRALLLELLGTAFEADLLAPLSKLNTSLQLAHLLCDDSEAGQVLAGTETATRGLSDKVLHLGDLVQCLLGSGLRVDLQPTSDLIARLDATVDEARAAWPQRALHCTWSGTDQLRCDAWRLKQTLYTLLDNALRHGEPGAVEVAAEWSDAGLRLSVSNPGSRISPSLQAQLFQPFARAGVSARDRGAALGLFVADQVARAHGGKLSLDLADGRTTFCLQLPRS